MKLLDRKQTMFVFGLIVILISINFVISIISTIHLLSVPEYVSNSHLVIYELEATKSELKEAEITTSSFIITGDESYLVPFTNSVNNIKAHLSRVTQSAEINKNIKPKVIELSSKIDDMIDDLNDGIDTRRDEDFTAAQEYISSDDYKLLSTDITNRITSLQDDERNLNETFESHIKEAKNRAIRTFIISAGSMAIMLVIFYFQFIERDQKKRTEKAKREIESRFQAIIEHSSDVIMLVDKDGRILYVGPSITNHLGYSVEESYGLEMFDLIHKNERYKATRLFKEMLENPGDLFPFLYRIVHKDGSYSWMEGIAANLINNLNLKAIVINLRDVSERIQFEEKIKQSTSEIEDLYNNSPCGYYSLSSEGLFLRVNDTFLKWTGYTREELVNKKKSIEIMSHDHLHLFYDNFASFMTRGFINNLEFDFIRKDGSKLSVLLNSTAIRNAKGEFVMTRSTVVDNTERKKAEIALRENEERFRMITENMQDMVCQLLDDGTISYISPSVHDLLGYGPQELLNTNVYSLIHPDDLERIRNEVAKKLEKGVSETFLEYRICKKDGSYTWFETNIHPIRNNYQEVINIQTSSRDISVKKNIELELKDSMNELKRFSYEVSANLSEPLSSLNDTANNLYLKCKDKGDEASYKELSKIISTSKRMQDTITKLLEYSMIKGDEKNFKTISMHEFINSLTHIATANEMDTSFKIVTPSVLPSILADKDLIEKLLLNLLDNSIKNKSDQDLVITIEHKDLKDEWVFTFSDNGSGFEMKHADKIFQEFQRIDNDINNQGSGLGLAICKKIVEQHGGNIGVVAEPGKGATFYFSIKKPV